MASEIVFARTSTNYNKHYINQSLETASVPTAFKSAHIRPLLKKINPEPNTLKTYRPVSNLPFISKILEKVHVVNSRIEDHLTLNNLQKNTSQHIGSSIPQNLHY
jgi:hypothetical protein